MSQYQSATEHTTETDDFWGESIPPTDNSFNNEDALEHQQNRLKDPLDPDTIFYYIRTNDCASLQALLARYFPLMNLNTVSQYLDHFQPRAVLQSDKRETSPSQPTPQPTSGGFTPLMIACQYGYEAIVHLLIGEYGASPLLVNSHGQCALHFALMHGHFRLVLDIVSRWYHHTKLSSSLCTYHTKQDLLQLLIHTFTRHQTYWGDADKTQEFVELLTLLVFSGKHQFNLCSADSQGETVGSMLTDFVSQFESPAIKTQEWHAPPSHLVPVIDMLLKHHWSFSSFYSHITDHLSAIIDAILANHNSSSLSAEVMILLNDLETLLSMPVYASFIQPLLEHRTFRPPLDVLQRKWSTDAPCTTPHANPTTIHTCDYHDSGLFDFILTYYLDSYFQKMQRGSSLAPATPHAVTVVGDALPSEIQPTPSPQTGPLALMAFGDVTQYSGTILQLFQAIDHLLGVIIPLLLSQRSSCGRDRRQPATCGGMIEDEQDQYDIYSLLSETMISPHSGAGLFIRLIEDDNRDFLALQLLQGEYTQWKNYTKKQQHQVQDQAHPVQEGGLSQVILHQLLSIHQRIHHRVELLHHLTNSLIFGNIVAPDSRQRLILPPLNNDDVHGSTPRYRLNIGHLFCQLSTHDRLGLTPFDHVSSVYNTPLLFHFICYVYRQYNLLSLQDHTTHASLLDKAQWFEDQPKLEFLMASRATARYRPGLFIHRQQQFPPSPVRSTVFSYKTVLPSSERHTALQQRLLLIASTDDGESCSIGAGSTASPLLPAPPFHLPLIYRYPEPYQQVCHDKLRSYLMLSMVALSSARIIPQESHGNGQIDSTQVIDQTGAEVPASTPTPTTSSTQVAILNTTTIFNFINLNDREFRLVLQSMGTTDSNAKAFYEFDYRQLFTVNNVDDHHGLLQHHFDKVGLSSHSEDPNHLSNPQHSTSPTSTKQAEPEAVSFFTLVRLGIMKSENPIARYRQTIQTVRPSFPPRPGADGDDSVEGTTRPTSRIDLRIYNGVFDHPIYTSVDYFTRLLEMDCDHFDHDLEEQFSAFMSLAMQDVKDFSSIHSQVVQRREVSSIGSPHLPEDYIDTLALLESCLLRLVGSAHDATARLSAFYTRIVDSALVNHPCFLRFLFLFMAYYLHINPTAAAGWGHDSTPSTSHRQQSTTPLHSLLAPMFFVATKTIQSDRSKTIAQRRSILQLIFYHTALELTVPWTTSSHAQSLLPHEEAASLTKIISDSVDAQNPTVSLLLSHLHGLIALGIVPPSLFQHDHPTFSFLTCYIEKLYAQQTLISHPLDDLRTGADGTPQLPLDPPEADIMLLRWLLALPDGAVDLNQYTPPCMLSMPQPSSKLIGPTEAAVLPHKESEQSSPDGRHYSMLTMAMACMLWSPQLVAVIRFVLTQPTLVLSAAEIEWYLRMILYHHHYELYYCTSDAYSCRDTNCNDPPALRCFLALKHGDGIASDSVNTTSISHLPSLVSFHPPSAGDTGYPRSEINTLAAALYADYTRPLSLDNPRTLATYLGEFGRGAGPSQASLQSVAIDPCYLQLLPTLCNIAGGGSVLQTQNQTPNILPSFVILSAFIEWSAAQQSEEIGSQQVTPTIHPPSPSAPAPSPHNNLLFDAIDARVHPTIFKSLVDIGLDTAGRDTRRISPISTSTTDFRKRIEGSKHQQSSSDGIPRKSDVCRPSLPAYLLASCVMTINYSIQATDTSQVAAERVKQIAKYFTHLLEILSANAQDSGSSGDPKWVHSENLLYVLLALPHHHAHARVKKGKEYLIPDYFQQLHQLLDWVIRNSTPGMLDSFACSLVIDDVLRAHPPPSGSLDTNLEQHQPTGQAIQSLLGLVLCPPQYLSNQTLFMSPCQQAALIQMLVAAGVDVNMFVYNTTYFSLDDISRYAQRNSQPFIHHHAPVKSVIFHSAVSLAVCLCSARRDGSDNASHLQLLQALLTTPSADVLCRLPRLVVDEQVYTDMLHLPVRAQRPLKRLLRELSQHMPQATPLFHTTPLELSLVQSQLATTLLPMLTAHPSYSPQAVHHLDHHIDCLATAILHPHNAYDLVDHLVQSGVTVSHGIFRYSRQQEWETLCIDDNNGHDFHHTQRTDEHATLSIRYTGKNAAIQTEVELLYNPEAHYGSIYATHPPEDILQTIVLELMHIQDRSYEIASTDYMKLIDFAPYYDPDMPFWSPDTDEDGPIKDPTGGSDQPTDIMPFIKAYALVLRSVLAYAMLVTCHREDVSSQIMGSSAASQQQHAHLISLLLRPTPTEPSASDEEQSSSHGDVLTPSSSSSARILSNNSTYLVLEQLSDSPSSSPAMSTTLSVLSPHTLSLSNKPQSQPLLEFYSDCAQLQDEIHPLLAFTALSHPQSDAVLRTLYQFDNGHTFNIPSIIHPLTNDTLPLYAMAFYKYHPNASNLFTTLIEDHQCMVNVVSSYHELSLIELLFVPHLTSTSAHSDSTPDQSTPPPFPFEIFKLLVEHGCDVRRYDRSASSTSRYPSPILAMTCYNANIHTIASLSTPPIPSDSITIPTMRGRSLSSARRPSFSTTSPTSTPPSSSAIPVTVTPASTNTSDLDQGQPTNCNPAHLILSTLMDLGCSSFSSRMPSNEISHQLSSSPVTANSPSLALNSYPEEGIGCVLLIDILQSVLLSKTPPFGVLSALATAYASGTSIRTTSLFQLVPQLACPDTAVSLLEVLKSTGYIYSCNNDDANRAFLMSLYAHRHSHRLLEAILTNSRIALTDNTASNVSTHGANVPSSYFRGLLHATTRNPGRIAKVLSDFGYVPDLDELELSLHRTEQEVIQAFHNSLNHLVWDFDTIQRFVNRVCSKVDAQPDPWPEGSILEQVQHVRRLLPVNTVFGLDFRSTLPMPSQLYQSFLFTQRQKKQVAFLALFYHVPEHTELYDTVQHHLDVISGKTEPPKRKLLTSYKAVSECNHLYSDPSSVVVSDIHHPLYFFRLIDYLTRNARLHTRFASFNKNDLCYIEASVIAMIKPQEHIPLRVSIGIQPLIAHYLDPLTLPPAAGKTIEETNQNPSSLSDDMEPSPSNSVQPPAVTTTNGGLSNSPQEQPRSDIIDSDFADYELISYPSMLDLSALRELPASHSHIQHSHIPDAYKIFQFPVHPYEILLTDSIQMLLLNNERVRAHSLVQQLSVHPMGEISTKQRRITSDVMEFVVSCIVFCFTMYNSSTLTIPHYNRLSYVQALVLNPYLTAKSLQLMMKRSILIPQFTEPHIPLIHVLAHRHHCDHYFDSFCTILGHPGIKFKVATTFPLKKEDGSEVNVTLLVHLSLFQGNERCITFLLRHYYAGGSPNASERRLLSTYARVEYADLLRL